MQNKESVHIAAGTHSREAFFFPLCVACAIHRIITNGTHLRGN